METGSTPRQMTAEDFFALHIDVNDILLPGPDGAPVAALELAIASANGLRFVLSLSAPNAIALGRELQKRGLACASRIVPSRMPAPGA